MSIVNAELVKVNYNTFITMKINFANNLMEVCHKLRGGGADADVDVVIDALADCNRRIISPAYMRGGMPDGGGCHPRDNIALADFARRHSLSNDIYTEGMVVREQHTRWFADLIDSHRGGGEGRLPVVVLGKSYKPETNLTVGSPSVRLHNELKERGVDASIWDPHVDGEGGGRRRAGPAGRVLCGHEARALCYARVPGGQRRDRPVRLRRGARRRYGRRARPAAVSRRAGAGVGGAMAAAGQDLDYGRVAAEACRFIRGRVEEAGAGGVVFGLSGGIDSAVVAHLCERALGAGRCLALIMPNESFTPDSETDDGLLVASRLGLRRKVVPIGAASDAAAGGGVGRGGRGRAGAPAATGGCASSAGTPRPGPEREKKEIPAPAPPAPTRAASPPATSTPGSARPCCTMRRSSAATWSSAPTTRSEYLIGYFTKYGDGASDLLPIADLYKTQVQRLGAHLGVPRHIVEKAPGPHLWKGHDAAGELGMGYASVDAILSGSTGGGRSDYAGVDEEEAVRAAAAAGLPEADARRVASLNRASAHKRALPPMARLRGLLAGA